MVWLILGHLVAFLVDLLAGGRRAPDERDREIVLLRHHLRVLLRKRGQPPRLARWEKTTTDRTVLHAPPDIVADCADDPSSRYNQVGVSEYEGTNVG